jgi:hypothetical protein
MDDNLDRANDEAEIGLAQALKLRKPEGPSPTGRCLWCDEITGETQRWCESWCRDQWEANSTGWARK